MLTADSLRGQAVRHPGMYLGTYGSNCGVYALNMIGGIAITKPLSCLLVEMKYLVSFQPKTVSLSQSDRKFK